MKDGFSNSSVAKWFKRKGFERIEFNDRKEYILTFYIDQPVSFKLIQAEGFDTFARPAFGGSVLVFECKIVEGILTYNCYAPIWLFGIKNKKLKFKKKPRFLFKYLKEGYAIQKEFDDFIAKKFPQQ